MKNVAAIALIATASALGAGHGLAQAHAVQATMPFDFTVGNKLLPSGTYTITPVSDDAIEIQNNNTHFAVLSPATPDSDLKTGCNLVFDKYAGQYFLREIAGGPSAFNVNLPVSSKEYSSRKQEAMAKPANQVFVAMNR